MKYFIIAFMISIISNQTVLGQDVKQIVDLKNAFHLYETVPGFVGRSELSWESKVIVSPFHWLDLTINTEKLSELSRLFKPYIDDETETGKIYRIITDKFYVEAELWTSGNREEQFGDDNKREGLLLKAEKYFFKEDEQQLAQFKINDLFVNNGGIPNGSTVRLTISIQDSVKDRLKIDTIPFNRLFWIEASTVDRVKFYWGCKANGTQCAGGKLSTIPLQNFIDINEPMNIYFDNSFNISKYVKLDDGSWRTVILDDINKHDGITDIKFEKGKTYKYEITRTFINDNKKEEHTKIFDRKFHADDYELFLFIPTSKLSFSDKIILPFIIPLNNKQLEGDDFQIGPGITVPLIAIKPRPTGTSQTGIQSMGIKFGGTLAYLQSKKKENEMEKEKTNTFGLYGGPYISFLDLLQFGISWKVSGDGPASLPYIGLMITKIPLP